MAIANRYPAVSFVRSIPSSIRRAVHDHPELALVLALAALLRIAVQIAYWPALFFDDSWVYLLAASHGHPVVFLPDRPTGYSAVLRLLFLPGRDLATAAIFQHLAGLVTAVLVYVLALSGGLSRRWAAGVTALIALDTWAIALEQRILTEAFFTLSLVAAAVLLTRGRRDLRFLFAAGLLIGAAVTMRTVALFTIPAALLYLRSGHGARRMLTAGLAAIAGAVLVIGGYGALHAHEDGRLGIAGDDGWFIYGRVAEFADCSKTPPPSGTSFLCQAPNDPTRKLGADFYVWSRRSPARRRLGDVGTAGSNEPLRRFARAVILHQPRDYMQAVAGDIARFAEPGQDTATGRVLRLPARAGQDVDDDPTIRQRLVPDYKPAAHPPARVLRWLSSWLHLPRPVLAALTLLAFGALIASVGNGSMVPHRRLILLLLLMGMGLLFGSAATSDFVLRYLIPAAPFLLLAGAIAARDLASHRSASRAA